MYTSLAEKWSKEEAYDRGYRAGYQQGRLDMEKELKKKNWEEMAKRKADEFIPPIFKSTN